MSDKEKTIEELLTGYERFSRRKARRARGISGYRCSIHKVLEYLQEQDLKFHEVKVKDARGYVGWLNRQETKEGRRYRKSSLRYYQKAAKSFFEYLKADGIVYANPFKEIPLIREEKRLPQNIPKPREMKILLDELKKYNTVGSMKLRTAFYRLHVVCELMYSTGMRVSEVANLRKEDIDFQRSQVEVREGKGGFNRVCYLNEYAKEVLRIYVKKMRKVTFNEWNERNGQLLFGVKWQTFEKQVNKYLKKMCKAAGVEIITSHGFRHSVGYHLLLAGCNIRHIQSILGHKALRHTEVYTKVDKTALKEVIDTCHPRQWKKVHDEEA